MDCLVPHLDKILRQNMQPDTDTPRVPEPKHKHRIDRQNEEKQPKAETLGWD